MDTIFEGEKNVPSVNIIKKIDLENLLKISSYMIRSYKKTLYIFL